MNYFYGQLKIMKTHPSWHTNTHNAMNSNMLIWPDDYNWCVVITNFPAASPDLLYVQAVSETHAGNDVFIHCNVHCKLLSIVPISLII